jgi:hypothetical protein
MRIVNVLILVDTPYAYIDTWRGSIIQPLVGNVQIFHTISRHQFSIRWSQISVYWLRYRVASKLN